MGLDWLQGPQEELEPTEIISPVRPSAGLAHAAQRPKPLELYKQLQIHVNPAKYAAKQGNSLWS